MTIDNYKIEEHFNLYGMHFILSGDVVEARKRAHHARRLMFQTEMCNVNDLEIIQNNYRMDDGTRVYVMSQHGLKAARIYVPLPVQAPKVREEKSIMYYPAFEAYNTDDEHIGYVIARGGGWKAPYEFVARPEIDEVDPFEWGQWIGTTVPYYDDLDEYLTHNQVREINTDRGDEKEVTTLWEIPPSGVMNQIGDSYTLDESNYEVTIPDRSCFVCCVQREPPLDLYVSYTLFSDFVVKLDDISRSDKKFEFKPITTPADRGPFDSKVYEFGVESLREDNTFIGNATRIHAPWLWAETCAGAAAAILADSGRDCSTAVTSDVGWDLDYINQNESFDMDSFITMHTMPFNYNEHTLFYDFDLSISEITTNQHDYSPVSSSAEDNGHYGLIYYNRDKTDINSRYESFSGTRCPHSASEEVGYGAPIQRNTIKFEYQAVLSGEVFTVGDYSVEDGEYTDHPIVRYYRDGGAEFLLGEVLVYDDLEEEDREARYVFISKTDSKTLLECEVTINRVGGVSILPDVTDTDGNPIYLKDKFRLIREDITKTIREQ